ncbi:MAG: sulfotransferase [Caulobacteraceae bacterium]
MTQTMDNTETARIEATAKTDRNLAIELAIAALGRGNEHPLVLRLVADGLEEDGRPQEAGNLLVKARAAHPRDVDVLTQFGRLLYNLRRLDEALAVFEDAIAIEPNSYDAQAGAGSACLNLNLVSAAREHYRRAAEIVPGAAEPLSALAVIAVRQEDLKQGRALAERALAIRPEFVRARMAIAQIELAEGAPALAETRLKRLLGRGDLNEEQRADGLSYLADALDALDRPSEAFGYYRARNEALQRVHTPAFKATVTERWVEQARRLTAWFEAAPRAPWRDPAGEDRRGAAMVSGHVFLMSFPRSGTTLLETVLASHPEVVALEEKTLLAEAGGHFLADDGGLRRLAGLDPAEADICRDTYWRGVREFFPEDISRKVLIDKLPLHTPALPVITKLFPSAKILFALRDPRDVVLSCFRRHFLINAAMYEFLTLEGTAHYYDQTMRLANIYRAILPLHIHDARNESLVADFEGETRKILNFLGLEWDAAIHDFPARARALSNTPSAPQVARGINASGVGQWRRYRAQLAPVLPLLEPWVARFGYAPMVAQDSPAKSSAAAAVSRVEAAIRAGDWPGAHSLVDEALAGGLRHPLFFRLRAVRAQQEGRLNEAIADFETVLADSGADFAILSALGLCLARAGRPVEGLARLDASIAVNPAFAPAHYNRGWTLEIMGDLARARTAYGRAVEIDPRHAQALGNLAAIAARAADWPAARRLADLALALDPAQPVAITALANAEAAGGELAAAEWRLRVLTAASATPSPHERAVAFNALGDVLDKLDRPGDAFTAYEATGALLRELYAARFAGPGAESSLGAARRLGDYFRAADRADWGRSASPATPRAARGHVFLIGFPRSGTTMLGQALAVHPGAVTLDERDLLADATAAFMGAPESLGRLAAIAPSEIDHHLDLYWRQAREAGAEVAGKVFIDKMPMNMLRLPLIVKLFPDAKVLLSRRDPRDVVLSAFRRQFVINPTTVELLDLADAARLYDAVMGLMEVYGDKLDVDLRVQSYESLVADFEDQIGAVCDFAGLERRSGLADFAGRAGAVATPSGAQLAAGLNAEGVGRWRRYAHELASVMPILAPWVERFGYEAR